MLTSPPHSREQQFTNFLTMKDYRNAIHLALQLNHPRRLLELFGTVASARPSGRGAGPAGTLLDSALKGAEAQSADAILAAAGVLSKEDAKDEETEESAEEKKNRLSITGLYAVDQIIAALPPLQLVQLLHHVRDWNTSTRTSDLAQTVLHAILRFHPAEKLLDAFEEVSAKGQTAAAGKHNKLVDADALLESILPYTTRHYARADRLLTESAMLEYTLSSMSALLGEEDEMEVDEERPFANGHASEESEEETDSEME